LEPVGEDLYATLPGGGFLLKDGHPSSHKSIYEPSNQTPFQFYRRLRFYEYDCEGNYVKEWAKPPSDLCMPTYPDEPAIIFPDRKYIFPLEWAHSTMVNHIEAVTDFGWVSEGFQKLYAFDKLGRVVCESSRVIERLSVKEKELRDKDQTPETWGSSLQGGDHVVWDHQGNAFFAIRTPRATYLVKLPWVEVNVPPLTNPAQIVPLDGWGRPLPPNGGPPRLALDLPGGALTFIVPEQVLPIENGHFPVYSLWDYQMSSFQRDKPWAIRGSIAGAGYDIYERYVPEFAPPVTVDANSFATEGYVLISGPNSKVKPYRAMKDKGQGSNGPEWIFTCHDNRTYNVLAQVWVENRPGVNMALDAGKPDIIRMKHVVLLNYADDVSLNMIETGPATKVFVAPTVMTRLSLSPKTLAADQRAIVKAYSKNWLNGKEDKVELMETEPGSRKFGSEDSAVLYELPYVFGEKDEVIPSPTPETVDRLYLYLTDPKLDLIRQPQLLFENGVDTGEYWSYAEPPYQQYSYKHWWQVSEEIEKAKFFIEASGAGVVESSILRLSWADAGGKPMTVDLPLAKTTEGRFRTTTPLVCFESDGCDIGGSWTWSNQVATPQIPGVVTFRETSVRWELVGATQ
jgi:hypothetical protein